MQPCITDAPFVTNDGACRRAKKNAHTVTPNIHRQVDVRADQRRRVFNEKTRNDFSRAACLSISYERSGDCYGHASFTRVLETLDLSEHRAQRPMFGFGSTETVIEGTQRRPLVTQAIAAGARHANEIVCASGAVP